MENTLTDPILDRLFFDSKRRQNAILSRAFTEVQNSAPRREHGKTRNTVRRFFPEIWGKQGYRYRQVTAGQTDVQLLGIPE